MDLIQAAIPVVLIPSIPTEHTVYLPCKHCGETSAQHGRSERGYARRGCAHYQPIDS